MWIDVGDENQVNIPCEKKEEEEKKIYIDIYNASRIMTRW